MRGFERCAFGVCIALAAMPAMADWKDDYARGLEAVREGRWSEAARLMDSAIAGNAQPVKRVRLYGQRYEMYAPQHYAGLAALRQGNCTAALRYWSQSANQAFVAANAALVEVEQLGRADCGAQVAQTKPTMPAPTPPRAEPAAVRDPPVVQQPPPATTAAPRPVVQSPPAATSTPPSIPVKPTVAAAPRATASAAAAAVRPVIDAYLGGHYADVLRLTASIGTEANAGWHLLILRAAAAYQLAQLGAGPADAEATARQAVAQARRLNATLRPDARFFSPMFIAFFARP